MGQLPVGQFQGPKENVLYKPPPHHFPPNMKSCGASAVPGPEVPVTILQNMVEAAASPEEKQEAQARLAELRTNRGLMEGVVRAVVDTVTGDSDLTDTMFSDNVELTRWAKYIQYCDNIEVDSASIIHSFLISLLEHRLLIIISDSTVTTRLSMCSTSAASTSAVTTTRCGC